jgi:hypothetical protein
MARPRGRSVAQALAGTTASVALLGIMAARLFWLGLLDG